MFVALLPVAAPDEASGLISKLHGTSAVLFFLCIAYVSLARSRDTLHLFKDAARRSWYERLYTLTGLVMIVSPAAAVVLSFALEPTSRLRSVTFWVETLGVWSFAAYWIIKTGEMRREQCRAARFGRRTEARRRAGRRRHRDRWKPRPGTDKARGRTNRPGRPGKNAVTSAPPLHQHLRTGSAKLADRDKAVIGGTNRKE